MTDTEFDPAETFPKTLRTWAYGLGTLFGLGVAPALLAVNQPALSGVAVAISGACNALAWGYRPTKGA